MRVESEDSRVHKCKVEWSFIEWRPWQRHRWSQFTELYFLFTHSTWCDVSSLCPVLIEHACNKDINWRAVIFHSAVWHETCTPCCASSTVASHPPPALSCSADSDSSWSIRLFPSQPFWVSERLINKQRGDEVYRRSSRTTAPDWVIVGKWITAATLLLCFISAFAGAVVKQSQWVVFEVLSFLSRRSSRSAPCY